MTTPTAPNPYVGPRTFERKDAARFFGRETEARDLLALVGSQRLVLFYAQSGAGKSSLINTRLAPQLEARGLYVLPVGRVGGELPASVTAVENIYLFNLMLSLDQGRDGRGGDPARLMGLTLGQFLHGLTSDDGQTWYFDPAAAADADLDAGAEGGVGGAYTAANTVLIVDQFEEIITTHADRWPERAGFFQQLDAAMQADPRLRVVLSLREDYVAALDPYAQFLADKLRARFYMERMGVEAALLAVQQPAADAGRPFGPGVAAQLVDDLRQVRVPGQEQTVPGQHVEPVQLQVVCFQLWARVAEARNRVADESHRVHQRNSVSEAPQDEITPKDLAEAGDVNKSLEQFYASTLTVVLAEPAVAAAKVSERRLRTWFDRELITATGIRSTVYRNDVTGQTGSLPNAAVNALSKHFLLRTELRGGGAWVELVHDRLVTPILAANQRWRAQHQSPVATAYEAYSGAGRTSARLLTGQALGDAQAYAAANPEDLSHEELAFLAESARVADQERQRRRTLVLIVVAALVIMAGLTTWALWNAQQANTQAHIARSREMAARSVEQLAVDPQASILLGLQAVDEEVTQEAEDALRRSVQNARVERYLTGQTELVQDVAFFPDGERLVSGGEDGTVRFWNMDGAQLLSVTLAGGGVTAVDVSPDGASVVAAQAGGALMLDAESGATRATLGGQEAHMGRVNDVVFSQDGAWVATAGDDGAVKLWDGATGAFVRALPHENKQPVWAVAFAPQDVEAPDTLLLTAGDAAGQITLWDALAGEVLQTLSAHNATVDSIAFSQDGAFMATGGWDNMVMLWDAYSLQPIYRLPGHSGWVRTVAFSPDDSRLVSTSWDRTAKVWDVDHANLLLTLAGHRGWVRGAAFSPDGAYIATTGQDGDVLLWNAKQNTDLALVDAHSGGVNAVTYSPDGRQVATAGNDGSVAVWDAATNQLQQRFAGSLPVNDVAFSPDGRLLLAGGDDRAAVLWDLTSGEEQGVFLGHVSTVDAVAFRGNGTEIATGSADNEVRIWRVADPTEPRLVLDDCESSVFDAAYDAAGGRIAAACGNGAIQIWDAESGALVHTLHGHRLQAYGVAFAPDSPLLVSVGKDGTAIMWNSETGAMVRQQPAHIDRVRAVAFSPDGFSFTTASWDMTAKQWDTASGAHLRTLSGQDNRLSSVAYAPDGKRIATASLDGSVLFYLTDVQDLIAMAQKELVRPLTAEECQLAPSAIGCRAPPR